MSIAVSASIEPNLEELPIARFYGEMAYEVAQGKGAAGELVEEFHSLATDLLAKSPDLQMLFTTAAIGSGKREEILAKIFRGRVSEVTFNTLMALNRRDRLDLVRTVSHVVSEIHEKRQGVVAVLVRSAVELPADRQAALEQTLKRRFNITPKLRFEVDPDILGGLWIRLGDTVYDRTVRWNLNRLKANILARKSHEVQG